MSKHDLDRGDGPRVGRPKRRHFTATYKLRIIEEYDAAVPGEKGALLRKEGLYDSSVQLWQRQRDSGELTASGPSTAQRPGKSPELLELERLRKENEKLIRRSERAEKKLAQTEAALDTNAV